MLKDLQFNIHLFYEKTKFILNLLKNMKLLQCDYCKDVIDISTERTKVCHCGATGGARTGDNLYSIWGKATPFDIPDRRLNLMRALKTHSMFNRKDIIQLGHTKNIA